MEIIFLPDQAQEGHQKTPILQMLALSLLYRHLIPTALLVSDQVTAAFRKEMEGKFRLAWILFSSLFQVLKGM